MSAELEMAVKLNSHTDGEINPSGIALNENRDGTKPLEPPQGKGSMNNGSKSSSSSRLSYDRDTCRRICLIAKLQSVFFPMKLFGLYFEDMPSPCGLEDVSANRRLSFFAKRSYQCFVLLIFWANVCKAIASFGISKDLIESSGVQALVPLLLWYLQTALQATICFFTMNLTPKKSGLKSLVMYWNTQPNFHELVAEPYMIKSVKRTMLVIYFFVVLNAVLYGLIMFLPSESLQPLAKAMFIPFPDSLGVRIVTFIISLYCTAAWLMPFGIFTAVCLTLIHQCHRLRKTLRLTASASEIRRIKILRQQHSSLCGSVRKVDNLFKFLTLVVYITNIPLVCFLLFDLIFKSDGVITQLTLSFWFVTVAFIMVSVSFLGAHLNSRVSTEKSLKFVLNTVS